VTRVHLAVAKLVAEGYFPVVVGQPNHVEVRGLVGDLDDYAIVLDEGDLEELGRRFAGRPRPDDGLKFGVVAQTTQPLERVLELVAALRARFPDASVRFVDTVCQPTKDRQEALRLLTGAADVIVVVGGPDSNNSRKLTELAGRLGRPAFQVAAASELRPEWFAGARVVGLTAGTSTPDRVIDEVRAWLEAL
jgi:4-hydroxy-3-methylbut-2-enyl diphosphate reductase